MNHTVDITGVNERLESFIHAKSNRRHVLGHSSQQNVMTHNRKSLQDDIDNLLAYAFNCKAQDDNMNTTVANAFLCKYYLQLQHRELVNVIRRQQSFIVRLLLAKAFDHCLVHLKIVHQCLTSLIINRDFEYHEGMVTTDLLKGIPINRQVSSPEIIKATIALHFLLVQVLLKILSSKLKVLQLNCEELTWINNITDLLLLKGNFMQWIQKDATNTKHHKNIITIITGLIAVCQKLEGTLDLKLTLTKLTLKSIEFQYLSNAHFTCDLSLVRFHSLESISKFHDDLITTVPIDNYPDLAMALTKHEPVSLSKEEIVQLVGDIRQKPELIENIVGPLTEGDNLDLCLDSKFLGACLITLQLIHHNHYKLFSSALLKFMIHYLKDLNKLTKQHLAILDHINMHIKSSKALEYIIDSASSIYHILFPFNQPKRIRNLSNLLYNLSLEPLPDLVAKTCLKNSIQYETYYLEKTEHDSSNKADIIHWLQVKVARYCSSLEKARSLKELSSVVVDFFSIVEKLHLPIDTTLPRLGSVLVQLIQSSPQVITSLLGTASKLKESCKVILFTNLIMCLEDSRPEGFTEMVELVVSSLDVYDSHLKLICFYHYYSFEGLDDFEDYELDINEGSNDVLYLSAIELFKAINIEWSLETIKRAISLFERYLEVATGVCVYEEEILSIMVSFLMFNHFYGEAKRMILTYVGIRGAENGYLKFDLLLDLSRCYIKLCEYEKVPELLEQSGDLLKHLFKNEGISSRNLLNWKLVQLSHLLNIDLGSATAKYQAVWKFASSKPEFQLSNKDSGDTMSTKLYNLYAILNFHQVACELSILQGSYTRGYLTVKTGLKLALSIVRSITHKLPRSQYYHLKWNTLEIINTLYCHMVEILKITGVSRDLAFFLNELKKLNDTSIRPLANGTNNFFLADNFLLMNQLERGYHELNAGNQICSMNIDRTLEFLLANSSLLKAAISKSDASKYIAKQKELMESFRQLTSDLQIILNFEKLLLENQYLARMFQEKIGVVTWIKTTGWVHQAGHMKAELSDLRRDDMTDKVIILPGFFESESLTFEHSDCLCPRIQELNSFGLQLPHYILKDLVEMMTLTAFLLPSVSNLEGIYYLNDVARFTPLRSEAIIRDCTIQHDKSILPFENLANDIPLEKNPKGFLKNVKSMLPDFWTVVSLDICNEGRDLIVSKFNNLFDKPIYLKIPLGRIRGANSFLEITEELRSIVEDSNLSIKPQTTSSIRTKEDRKQWWKLRFGLDLRMKELLDSIENKWLGMFKGIFNSNPVDVRFLEELVDLINKSLHQNLLKEELNPMVVQILLGLDVDVNLVDIDEIQLQRDMLDDVLYLILESLNGNIDYKQINVDEFHQKLAKLIAKHKQEDIKGHIVLIPGSSCASIPWESMNCLSKKSISRMPSIHMLIHTLHSRPSMKAVSNAMYLINPGGDLLKTEARFTSLFENMPGWEGLIGTKPKDYDEFLIRLLSKDLFIYIGHGGCEQYVKVSSLFRLTNSEQKLPPSLLIGCSSGALDNNGILEASGNVYNWLSCGSPMVLANLWDVTDKDIDKFSLAVFESTGLFGHESSVDFCQGVRMSRHTCNLKYLNGSAPVIYGLPLRL